MSQRGANTDKDSGVIYRCDSGACGSYVIVSVHDELPSPWRVVYLPGIVGALHACSDVCAANVQKRLG